MLTIELLCKLLMFILATPTEPSGRVFQMPVNVWAERTGDTTRSVSLKLPEIIDESGTVTVRLRGDSSSRLICFSRHEMPADLHFLYGESDRLFLRIMGSADWEYDEPQKTFTTGLPYNRNPELPPSRRVQIVDIVGQPLTKFRVRLSLHGPFNAYDTIGYSLPLDSSAQVILPPVVDPLISGKNARTQPGTLYHLHLTDPANGQVFVAELKHQASVPVTRVIVPTSDPSADVAIFKGTVVNADQTKVRPTTITIIQNYRPPTTKLLMDPADSETVTVTKILPGSEGQFSIAADPALSLFELNKGNLEVQLAEEKWGLFSEMELTLHADRNNTITLPRRLDLTVQLIGKDSHPVDVESQINGETWGGVCVKQLKPDCRLSRCNTMGFRFAETTGSAFILRNIAVPCRFVIENQGTHYGPFEVGETSPTEVIAVHAMRDHGMLRGTIRDEMGNPLSNAGILVVKSHKALDELRAFGDLSVKIGSLSTSDAVSVLEGYTSDVLGLAFTNASGEYAIERKRSQPGNSPPVIIASATGRIGATIIDTTSECDVAFNHDVTLPEVRLPLKATVSGSTTAPSIIPDEDKPGFTKPIQEAFTYKVFHRSSRNWFDQKGEGTKVWQYETAETSAPVGQPFTLEVPVGTRYQLGAKANITGLSLAVWDLPALKRPGMHVELQPRSFKPLQPFWLKVSYADGSPGTELVVNALHAPQGRHSNGAFLSKPQTDEAGKQLLYAEGSTSPWIELSSVHRESVREWIKPQRLDSSTSVPVLTVRLDPKIWSVRGTTPLEFKQR